MKIDAKTLVRLPGRLAVAVVELVLSRRGLPLGYLAFAAILAASCWLRPPLSPDIRSYHLPVWSTGAVQGRAAGLTPAVSPDTSLNGPRPFVPDSVGVVLLLVIAVGTAVVAWRPRHLGTAAGVLLAATLAGNAAVAWNHPALIEMLDHEYEQRRQVATLVVKVPEQKAMANPHNGRIAGRGSPQEDEQRGDLVRGPVYLLYGQWLIPWAVGGVLFGTAGSWPRRWKWAAVWGLAGVGLAGAVCWPRLQAEWAWERARDLEGAGDFASAREALDESVRHFPEMADLERTWLLGGKIDFQLGLTSPEERYFRAYQLGRDKSQPRAVAFTEDLPWLMVKTNDYRSGIATPPSGLYEAEKPDAPETGTPFSHERLPLPRSEELLAYRQGLSREPRKAVALMDDLLAAGQAGPAVRHQAARLWTDLGLRLYLDRPILTSSELDFFRHDRRLTSAAEAWGRAGELDPGRRDTGFYLGVVGARVDPDHPDRVEAAFAPILEGLADRPLRGEILDMLGDTYWEAGRVAEARQRYALSYDTFSLPKRPNIRAQKKLGGL